MSASNKPLTTEAFIERARGVHGNLYSYEMADYTRSFEKLIIICPKHGQFKQTPSKHLTSYGCPECGKKKARVTQTMPCVEFVERARAIHGLYYDYSLVSYITARKAVEIICPVHGIFTQIAGAHLVGKRCKKCAQAAVGQAKVLLAAKSFVARSLIVHGPRFDYTAVDYKGNHRRVAIKCLLHGPFMQAPSNHLSGQSCPECGRLARGGLFKEHWVQQAGEAGASLYFLRVFNEAEVFFKIGITRNTVEDRYRKKASLSGYQYEVLAVYKSVNAAAVWDWEQSILETFAHLKYFPKRHFIGETECFSSCDEILAIFPL